MSAILPSEITNLEDRNYRIEKNPTIGEKIEDTAQLAKDKASEAALQVQEWKNDAEGFIKNLAETAKDKATNAASEAQSKFSSTTSEVQSKASDIGEFNKGPEKEAMDVILANE